MKRKKNRYGLVSLGLLIGLCTIGIWSCFFSGYVPPNIGILNNLTFDLFGIVLCTAIFATIVMDQHINNNTIIFMLLAILIALLLFYDLEGWIINGNPEKIRLNKLLCHWIYGLMLGVILAFWYYLKELYRSHEKEIALLSKTMFAVFVIGMLLIASNPFTEIYFVINDNFEYERTQTYFVSQIPGYVIMMACLYCVLRYETKPRRKASLLAYLIVPLVCGAVQLIWYGISLQYISLLFSLFIIYCSLYIDRSAELRQNEVSMSLQRTSIMISQIQPHFLYNALTSIMAIKGNPPETTEAIATFGKYLRGNLDSLTQIHPIPFYKELDQTERYIFLRKLKYGDRLVFDYDIGDSTFFIPPLTLKLIIEAVIHYNLEKDGKELGISIKTGCDKTNHIIEIHTSHTTETAIRFVTDPDNKLIAALSKRLDMVDGTIENVLIDGMNVVTSILIPLQNKVES